MALNKTKKWGGGHNQTDKTNKSVCQDHTLPHQKRCRPRHSTFKQFTNHIFTIGLNLYLHASSDQSYPFINSNYCTIITNY